MTQLFNACEYLLDRRLAAGDGSRLALTGAAGELTYAQLHDRVGRTAAGLRAIGLQPEQRILMLMADTPEFVIVYLAAMRAGAIPVPVSTMLRADGVAELLTDSRARFLAVTREFAATAVQAAAEGLGKSDTAAEGLGKSDTAAEGLGKSDTAPELAGILADQDIAGAPVPVHLLERVMAAPFSKNVYPTSADSPAFWLYTSGTTGRPKAAMHRHGAVPVVCESYGAQVLGIRPGDRCLSSAKAFFAYGLGNSVLFPLSVGAVSVLERALSTPEAMAEAARDHGATLFFAGPTFFAAMLRAGLPRDALAGVRLAASAGETLPAALYHRWTSHFGVDVIDGLGMTEILHIFLSNQRGRASPTSGMPTATTPAWAATATCSSPAASGSRRPRWRPASWLTRPSLRRRSSPPRTAAGPVRHRNRADRVLPPGPAVRQTAPQGGVHRRLPDHRHGEGPPGRAA